MFPRSALALFVVTILSITGCTKAPNATNTVIDSPAPSASTSKELSDFFESVFQRDLARSPLMQTYLGIKTDYGKWDDLSDAHAREDHKLAQDDLATLRGEFSAADLSDADRLSYRLFEYEKEVAIASFKWRFHNYPANQMYGEHSGVPATLINFHLIDDEADAEAYISRLVRVPHLFEQHRGGLLLREKLGVLPPAFVFPRILSDCENILRGAPFDDSGVDSPLLADFRSKLAKLESISEARKAELVSSVEKALLLQVRPAYVELMELLKRQASAAKTDDGAWKFPDGANYYAHALKQTTTTEMSADEIHELGLQEVDRIHGEMQEIMKKVEFAGSLEEFFAFMRTDKRFYFENTEEGRAEYLQQATQILGTMKARLPELFVSVPKAEMVVKRVEPYREKSAGKAFYSSPAIDGSRPGIYYANLYNMAEMPSYQMEALAYHEGIPGHHMQNAISQELGELPKFRRFGHYTAYGEGWGLYAEFLPKEMGFYEDPYSDFGRLAMELWRACRLVVDTGIHSKRWTREQAIDYLKKNTPNAGGDIVKAIERYIVMPSQATAYKVGMRKILSLRERAQAALGSAFDLREFHEAVLTSGPVPLEILEERIDSWIAEQQPRAEDLDAPGQE